MEGPAQPPAPLAIVGLPAGLILLQPDAGTVLVFLGFVFALYREGMTGPCSSPDLPPS